jgi:hypothetical protein
VVISLECPKSFQSKTKLRVNSRRRLSHVLIAAVRWNEKVVVIGWNAKDARKGCAGAAAKSSHTQAKPYKIMAATRMVFSMLKLHEGELDSRRKPPGKES